MGELEIRPVPSYYDKNHLPSLTSTQLVFFDKVHIKQVSGPPTNSQNNSYNFLFPRYEEWKVDVEIVFNDTNNQPKRATFKCEREGGGCLGVSRVESK